MWIPVESTLMNTPQSTAKVNSGEVVSVSWLNRAARDALEGTFPLMWIAGEVSTLTRAASGHLYFTLKDEQAQVRCTMWRNRAQLLSFRLEHGMRVEVRALVTLFEPRGDYQLSVEAVRQAGVGNLYEAFLRLKARLEAEGLFDSAIKRSLPRLPRGIAVVTSQQAAAWQDVTAALARRAPHVPITLYPTQVQGDRRRVMVSLTDEGRRMYELILPEMGKIHLDLVSVLGDAELAQLDATLVKLQAHAQELEKFERYQNLPRLGRNKGQKTL